MPRRDPETGQYVSGTNTMSTNSDLDWNDMHQLHVQQTARVVDASSTSGSFQNERLPEIDLQRSDTLSLDSDEAAEMVALTIRSHRAYVDDNDFGEQGNFRASMMLSKNYAVPEWLDSNDLESDLLGQSGEIAGRTRIEDDSRVLWFGSLTYQNATGVVDTGAPILYPSSTTPFHLNFRHEFGSGPVFDDTDSLQHGATYNIVNMGGNANIVQVVDWTAYFDIFEVEHSITRV